MSASAILSRGSVLSECAVSLERQNWPMLTKRPKPLEILKQTVLEWQQDNVPTQAAALAYYTVFAIAPLLLVVLAVAGLFTSADAARARLLTEIGDRKSVV